MPLDHILDQVTTALDEATTVAQACERATAVFAVRTRAMAAVLLCVRDHLRCVSATGSWHVYASIDPGTGVIGRVYTSGRSTMITEVDRDEGDGPLSPRNGVEICVPVAAPGQEPIGVFNAEWPPGATPAPDSRRSLLLVVEEIGRRIGARVHALGGPPHESSSERLLRHALAFSTADSEAQLLARSLVAAREVAGLSTPAVLLPGPDGVRLHFDQEQPTEMGRRLAGLDPAVLARIAVRARRHGSSYTLGSPHGLDARGFEPLIRLGVETMITIPVGPARTGGLPSRGAIMLVVDERAVPLDPATINLLELLAAHAWTSLDRLRTLRRLSAKASSDPLTGLGHYGMFGERLGRTVPGGTALFAIDVDRFKQLNDTYGHAAGDQALIGLARALQSALRAGDELYRVGGDEFAAVIEVHRADEALAVAQRLVDAARRVGHTVSVGVAMQDASESAEDTLRRADLALYDVKRTGRDGVRLAGPRTDVPGVS